MANINEPYRRVGTNSWEELLDAVNDKLQNPPDNCDPIDEIDTPEECHRWAKSDIREVHDKLNEMPGDCFDFEDIPDLWKKSIIDDIENQLDNSWCDCGCTDEDRDKERALTGTEIILATLPPVLFVNCPEFVSGENIRLSDPNIPSFDQSNVYDICNLHGTQVAQSGFSNRFIKIKARFVGQTEIIGQSIEPVDCEGIAHILFCDEIKRESSGGWTFGVCPTKNPPFGCGTEPCNTLFTNALAFYSTLQTTEIVMELLFNAVACEEC